MDFYQQIKKKNLIAAHRGYRAAHPENTLEAFELAINHFDFIELDVQHSKDSVLMVFHDDNLERTTNIESISTLSRPHRLVDYDYDELRKLDAGSWFYEIDPFGTIKNNGVPNKPNYQLKIPTLEETLKLWRKHIMPLNIEIKDSPLSDTAALLQDILDTIAPYRKEFPILISSFNHRYLSELHLLDPSLSLAANVEYRHPPKLTEYLPALGVCAYHVDDPLAVTTPVEELGKLGITCSVFTVNDSKKQNLYFEKGFRSVFADMPPAI